MTTLHLWSFYKYHGRHQGGGGGGGGGDHGPFWTEWRPLPVIKVDIHVHPPPPHWLNWLKANSNPPPPPLLTLVESAESGQPPPNWSNQPKAGSAFAAVKWRPLALSCPPLPEKLGPPMYVILVINNKHSHIIRLYISSRQVCLLYFKVH